RGKHSGVIAAIHERFVKTGRLSPECGAAIRRLFRLRGIGDYGAPEHVSQQEARDALNLAHEFVAEVKPLIEEDEA
ncbi:MAG: HEPN domain-containing protein, partial [Planctomycetota bacterium]